MTNDKKQTSVEWLIEQVEGLNINDDTVWAEVTKQALEMEKQQIIDARVNGKYDSHLDDDCETYYEETYGETS